MTIFNCPKLCGKREDGAGGEPEGRAAAQVACEPTAGISVRGCLCVCARAPQLRVWPACIAHTRT